MGTWKYAVAVEINWGAVLYIYLESGRFAISNHKIMLEKFKFLSRDDELKSSWRESHDKRETIKYLDLSSRKYHFLGPEKRRAGQITGTVMTPTTKKAVMKTEQHSK